MRPVLPPGEAPASRSQVFRPGRSDTRWLCGDPQAIVGGIQQQRTRVAPTATQGTRTRSSSAAPALAAPALAVTHSAPTGALTGRQSLSRQPVQPVQRAPVPRARSHTISGAGRPSTSAPAVCGLEV